MPSGTFLHYGLKQAALLLWLVGCGHAEKNCTGRRCVAQELISRGYVSQPQYDGCSHDLNMYFIEYQTITVDTKNLRLISRMIAEISWNDPGLKWDIEDYDYAYYVSLPVDKVWTPELRVTNGIVTTMTHASRDLRVYFTGDVEHKVILNAEVNCDVNMFNYPFAADQCPVAIETVGIAECASTLVTGYVNGIGKTRGDWQTESVQWAKHNYGDYIIVSLKTKQTNPFITLLLPTILIVLADVVSFSLPLQGGERNSFKVTLVLSFTMFLNILNEKLPEDGECSPVIKIHFCICLVLMVVSMLVSLVLTRVAKDGGISFCCFSKKVKSKPPRSVEDKVVEEITPDIDISVIQLDGPEEDKQMLRKVVKFLDDFQAKDMENERYQRLADSLDKTFFWIYFVVAIGYFCAMNTVMVVYKCDVDHFDFFYNSTALAA